MEARDLNIGSSLWMVGRLYFTEQAVANPQERARTPINERPCLHHISAKIGLLIYKLDIGELAGNSTIDKADLKGI